ncbi:hypothetical protein CK203_028470 [Vitis vinifera]|uniref:Uncharacterized protein n=1 Tax=Vitis vinifera TaxID=29760 RepID=A0A438I264_VITVI|nr:hypothetical protein CK203_028470 [Vitis vinifera]
MEESFHEITSPLISKGGDSSLEPSSSSLKPDPDEENSPIKQVALTVPTTDDPSLPMLTFRISDRLVPLGRLMAAKITDRVFFKGTPGIHPKSRAVQRQRARSHHYYVVFSAAVVLLIIAVDVQSPCFFLRVGGHFPALRRRPCLHHRPVAPHKRSVGAGSRCTGSRW